MAKNEVSKVFTIEEDEFEGRKAVYSEYSMSGNPELDQQCEIIGALKPSVDVLNITDGDGSRFFIRYDEQDMIEELEKNEMEDVAQDVDSPCKGMFVIVDGTETIKLNAEYSNHGISAYQIEQDLFLKCCKAHKLEFKIFKQEGSPIVIRGNEEDEDLMIASFQSLYNYIVDNTMFPDAAAKIERWRDREEEKFQQMEKQREQRRKQKKKAEDAKGQRNIAIGGVGIAIGVILFIVGVCDFSDLYIILILGIILGLVGAAFLIFGIYKKKGYSDVDALNKVTEILQNIKFK